MEITQLEEFLLKCTLINMAILVFMFLILFFSEVVYSIHKHFYAGSLEEFEHLLYVMMGAYKLIWLFFNAIPYLVLRQMKG